MADVNETINNHDRRLRQLETKTVASTTGLQGITGETGLQGSQGDKGGIRYSFSTTTSMADPGTGLIRFNSGTFGSITAIAIDDLDKNSVDVSAYIISWDDFGTAVDRGTIEIKSNVNNVSQIALFRLTALTDNAGWTQLTVTPLSGSVPANAAELVVSFHRTGLQGLTGLQGPAATMTISGSSITDTTAYLMSVPDATVGAQAASVDADLYFNGTSNALRSGITTGGFYTGGTSITDNGTTGDIYSDKATLNIDAATRVSSITIATTTTASGVNMNINTASPYALRVSTSSFRIKNDISPLSEYSSLSSAIPEDKLSETPAINYKDILQISPVTFKSLIEDDDVTKVRIGLIAEDIESKIPELSTYNEDGSVAYFDVNGIIACLLAVVQEQQVRIEQLESSLNP